MPLGAQKRPKDGGNFSNLSGRTRFVWDIRIHAVAERNLAILIPISISKIPIIGSIWCIDMLDLPPGPLDAKPRHHQDDVFFIFGIGFSQPKKPTHLPRLHPGSGGQPNLYTLNNHGTQSHGGLVQMIVSSIGGVDPFSFCNAVM